MRSETVLVLQGGGSLGAYECGVYRTLAKHNIKFDIIAGTSIGAVNASIITSTQDDNNSAEILEHFWLTLAENILPPILMSFFTNRTRAALASIYGTIYGNSKAFMPRWFMPNTPDYLSPYNWTYLYDSTPLKNTLKQYVDFTKLKTKSNDSSNNDNNNNDFKPRLILTSTDIQRGEPVIFDSNNMDIDVDHVIACTGYPFYGISWTKKDGRYLWDGSLLSNTPVLEVINASPRSGKKFYIVDIFPRVQEHLPKNMSNVWHRARDIMYIDKVDNNVKLLNVVTEHHLNLLKELYEIVSSSKLDEKNKVRFDKIQSECNRVANEHHTILNKVTRIQRKETEHFIFEDADFSVATIKKLIRQGEQDAENAIREKRSA
ncbi:MAG: patatin-like phospholipase family protein [Nitrososphaeraceae archaeon]|nr:patatin-like phospholipase family protein [Nitrososphaeraceae archaeon]